MSDTRIHAHTHAHSYTQPCMLTHTPNGSNTTDVESTFTSPVFALDPSFLSLFRFFPPPLDSFFSSFRSLLYIILALFLFCLFVCSRCQYGA